MRRLTPRAAVRMLGCGVVILVVAYLLLNALAPAGRPLAKVHGEDPVGYFGVTHSLLFDRDVNLTNEYERMPPDARIWTPVQKATGLPGHPWGVGISFLELPFLAIGTALDGIAGNPTDGYSHYALLIYCLGSPFFTGVGLIALFMALQNAPDYAGGVAFNATLALAVVLAVFFGTNVGYYAFSQSSHASTFMMAAIFVACWLKARQGDSLRDWVLAGVAGGVFTICRWQDLLFLGVPFFYELLNWKEIRRGAAWWRSRAAFTAMVVACWIPQMLTWKAIYGKYLTIPQGDGFLQFPPQWVIPTIFSSRNGWFTWTPLALVCCIGLVAGVARLPRRFAPWVIVLILEIMVVGAMRTWHGYDSFGARYLLSMAPIIMLGLWHMVNRSGVFGRSGLAAVVLVCCAYTGLFAIQFRFDLIPKDETLTTGEMFADKLRPGASHRRKMALASGREALSRADGAGAVAALRPALAWGEDRRIERELARAMRLVGDTAEAEAAEARYRAILQTRWP